jgi:hypothetical protein
MDLQSTEFEVGDVVKTVASLRKQSLMSKAVNEKAKIMRAKWKADAVLSPTLSTIPVSSSSSAPASEEMIVGGESEAPTTTALPSSTTVVVDPAVPVGKEDFERFSHIVPTEVKDSLARHRAVRLIFGVLLNMDAAIKFEVFPFTVQETILIYSWVAYYRRQCL